VGKIDEKAVCWSDNMTLYLPCRINKNALLQLFFWRFCPLGYTKYIDRIIFFHHNTTKRLKGIHFSSNTLILHGQEGIKTYRN